jgi:hypothetical protein
VAFVPAKICKRCGGTEEVSYTGHFCKACIPTKEQLYQLYVLDRKSKRQILDIVNVGYSRNLSWTKLKTLSKIYNLKKSARRELVARSENAIRRICVRCNKAFIEDKNNNEKYCDKYCRYCRITIKEAELEFKNKVENKDFVTCRICGEKKECLVTHVTRLHKISANDYREKYNALTLCENYSKEIGNKSSAGMKAAWKEGRAKRDNSNFWHRNINESEKILQKLSKNILYVGGNKRGCKNFRLKTSYYRNPDFVVINDESYLKELENFKNWYDIQNKVSKDFQEHNIKVNKIVEFNGYYWHQLRFNGRTKEEYERDMIQDYKLANVDCLVIWDDELKDLQKTKTKIDEFVQV